MTDSRGGREWNSQQRSRKMDQENRGQNESKVRQEMKCPSYHETLRSD